MTTPEAQPRGFVVFGLPINSECDNPSLINLIFYQKIHAIRVFVLNKLRYCS
ncbi:hypothetical protein PhaeoP18_02797 [Phaeobacter piscinae]|uniref:Uncharacterized protein n=1 Tax=Phaeobacter piscinae TaxID=1580596 RepID=A0AAN1GT93_9RHOB|nr:hypothetical protein PhaeoP13_02818 [Phaeobacter piscinae]AUR37035.1 hypothetical protein PhaeoP18_02797 [Phaeobacter piscinae]